MGVEEPQVSKAPAEEAPAAAAEDVTSSPGPAAADGPRRKNKNKNKKKKGDEGGDKAAADDAGDDAGDETAEGAETGKKGKGRKGKGTNWMPFPVGQDNQAANPNPNSAGEEQQQPQQQQQQQQQQPQQGNPHYGGGYRGGRGRGGYGGYRGRGRGGYAGYGGHNQDYYGGGGGYQYPGQYQYQPYGAEGLEMMKDMVRNQIEYYFSVDNLCRDMYLRVHGMNAEGWVTVQFLASFNRVRALGADASIVSEALSESTLLEMKDGAVRLRETWKNWIVKEGEEGAKSAQDKDVKDVKDIKDVKDTKITFGTVPPTAGGDENELFEFDEEQSAEGGHAATTTTVVDKVPVDNEDEDDGYNSDSSQFDDDLVRRLIIVTQKDTKAEGPESDESLATLLDEGLQILESEVRGVRRRRRSEKDEQGPEEKLRGRRLYAVNSADTTTMPGGSVGWIMGSKSMANSSHVGSPSSLIGTPIMTPTLTKAIPFDAEAHQAAAGSLGASLGTSLGTSLPNFSHPSKELLSKSGFVQTKYPKFRLKALRERKRLGPLAPEMVELYVFWQEFLRSRFNDRMYHDFKVFAIEDANMNMRGGLKALFSFLSKHLECKFSQSLFNDFQDLAVQDYINGAVYGLEKVWEFRKNHTGPTTLKMKNDLTELLKHYTCIEDFRQ